jgi:hypothetical protein
MDAYAKLAEKWGITIDSSEQESFEDILSGMHAAFETIENEPQAEYEILHGSPRRHTGRETQCEPTAEADPHNAWLCRC